jgi:hypothetical protein
MRRRTLLARAAPVRSGACGRRIRSGPTRRPGSSCTGGSADGSSRAAGEQPVLPRRDFFEPDWARASWGPNNARLLRVKETYDPDGLFIVHHGVGSERWSPDGFSRRA